MITHNLVYISDIGVKYLPCEFVCSIAENGTEESRMERSESASRSVTLNDHLEWF